MRLHTLLANSRTILLTKSMRIALFVIFGIALTASAAFALQGGFGGGHGDLDKAIFILSLPWSLFPWPEFLLEQDFIWLIVLPFVLNVSVIVIIAAAIITLRNGHSRDGL